MDWPEFSIIPDVAVTDGVVIVSATNCTLLKGVVPPIAPVVMLPPKPEPLIPKIYGPFMVLDEKDAEAPKLMFKSAPNVAGLLKVIAPPVFMMSGCNMLILPAPALKFIAPEGLVIVPELAVFIALPADNVKLLLPGSVRVSAPRFKTTLLVAVSVTLDRLNNLSR
jgi:hypothetical protein